MYPTSNPNNNNNNNAYVQQVAAQPMYQPALYAQNVSSQPRIDNSQVVNQQVSLDAPQPQYPVWSQSTYNGYPQGVVNPLIRQPMMYSLSRGAQYVPVYQYPPVHNGQSSIYLGVPDVASQNASTQVPSNDDSVSDKNLYPNPQSELKEKEDSVVEELPSKIQDFLQTVLKSVESKVSPPTSSEAQNPTAPTAQPPSEQVPLQKQFEQFISLQQQIVDLLQPLKLDAHLKPVEPKSYELAMERFKAHKPEEPKAPEFVARKNASMVFIYDIDDITQLSNKIFRAVRRMFPDLKKVSNAVQMSLDFLTEIFFEFNEDQDCDDAILNVNDGHFGSKVGEYLEFKKKCETNGSNITYEFIKAVEEEMNTYNADNYDIEKNTEDNEEKVEEHQVIEFQKLFEKLWKSAKRCLQAITDKSLKNTYDNVVLSDMIGYGAAQLLISGLASDVPLENIYSSRMTSKDQILERIQRDYGDDCVLVVVTSDAMTVAAAEKQNMLVWPVDSEDSLDALYTAQKSHLLE